MLCSPTLVCACVGERVGRTQNPMPYTREREVHKHARLGRSKGHRHASYINRMHASYKLGSATHQFCHCASVRGEQQTKPTPSPCVCALDCGRTKCVSVSNAYVRDVCGHPRGRRYRAVERHTNSVTALVYEESSTGVPAAICSITSDWPTLRSARSSVKFVVTWELSELVSEMWGMWAAAYAKICLC